jgi:acyl carrier protein
MCDTIAVDDLDAKANGCCDECAHLLRWFRGYIEHDPSFGVTWWIKPETTFNELGVQSLDGMHWLLGVEEKLGIDIPDKDVEKLYTVGQFVRYLRAKGASWPSEYESRLVQKGSCIPLRGYVWEKVPRQKTRPESCSKVRQPKDLESGMYDSELDG